MRVRFKNSTLEPRISYRLISEQPEVEWDDIQQKTCWCYNVEGLGFVDSSLMEITNDEPDIKAGEVSFDEVALALKHRIE
jgi:hypothetical protein